MFSKVPRFLITSIASLLMVGCGIDMKEAVPNQTEDIVEVSEDSTNKSEEIVPTPSPENVADEEEEPVESSSQVEESEIVEIEPIEAIGKESLEKNKEQALDHLLVKTHLEREGYSYYFIEKDSLDFIEIEVREIQATDSEHASLEGVYRYLIETEEIFMRDYLTGDFIPYEEID